MDAYQAFGTAEYRCGKSAAGRGHDVPDAALLSAQRDHVQSQEHGCCGSGVAGRGGCNDCKIVLGALNRDITQPPERHINIGKKDVDQTSFCIFTKIFFMAEQHAPNQLNIEISEEVAEGQYANLVIITHSHAEFVIDFVNVMPGTPKSKVKSRLILTPQHAKRFMKALTENVVRFEGANGKIQDLEEVQVPLNFGGTTAQA